MIPAKASKADGITFPDMQISLGSAEAGDDRLAAREQGPENPRAGDVVSMAVSVHSVQQLEPQLLNQLSIPMRCLQNGVDQNCLS